MARWKKALAGLNRETGGMTAAGARQMKAKYSPGRWQPVVDGLDCLEKAATPQAETPAAVPELSLAAGPAVDEGGNAAFTVHADPAPAAELTVAFTVAQSGEYLDAPGRGQPAGDPGGGAASATLAIATADDEADEADGSVGVTLDAGAGYTLAAGKAAAKVAVRDNDTPAVSVAAGTGVTEGDPASFTLTANPAPHADLTVSLAVTQSGDFAASGQTGAREVTIPTGGSASFEVATVNDSADEPDGSVSVTVGAGTGYAVAASPDDTASVAVADDDAAPGVPALAIGDVRANEGDGFMWFTVTLSPASDRAVSVDYRTRESNPVSARKDSDFSRSISGGSRSVRARRASGSGSTCSTTTTTRTRRPSRSRCRARRAVRGSPTGWAWARSSTTTRCRRRGWRASGARWPSRRSTASQTASRRRARPAPGARSPGRR